MRIVHSLIPGCAGALMLAASFLPWLNDPLGGVNSAWSLPIDIGWQFHSMILSYGLLCLCCVLPTFFLVWTSWREAPLAPTSGQPPLHPGRPQGIAPTIHARMACFARDIVGAILCGRPGCGRSPGLLPTTLLCFLPCMLFCLQYLFADIHSIEVLAQHKTQMLLVQQHFGYKIPDQFIQQLPLELTTSTLAARFTQLINEVSAGVFVSFVSACLLAGYYFLGVAPQAGELRRSQRRLVLAGFCVGILLLMRAPLAMVGTYEAKEALAAGNYTTATFWLDSAAFFNPTLEQASYYHILRGQAQYFLSNGSGNGDSHQYLAFVYRQQGDYLDAYQELQALRGAQPGAPAWIAAEMSVTLTQLAESSHHQASTPLLSAGADTTIQPWLQTLLQVDNRNIYGHYVLGRIHYDLHNYSACITQMMAVLQISQNMDAQSSAYTYIALSLLGQGHTAEARQLLLKAIALDPNYRNNTAREELSGLH